MVDFVPHECIRRVVVSPVGMLLAMTVFVVMVVLVQMAERGPLEADEQGDGEAEMERGAHAPLV